MTQDQWIIVGFKAAEVAGIAAILLFVVCYTAWARWWDDPIGRTIVVKDLLLILLFVPAVLSMFFQFSRLTSRVVAWSDVAMLGLIAPVMAWRTWVFWKVHKRRDGHDGSEEGEALWHWLTCPCSAGTSARELSRRGTRRLRSRSTRR
ncbi:MAG TPA: hypothetical protein VKU77_09070 [Streptosporangiaceae bacterium]|nr:hypothetical protein [Streptosporangiaceae bacterium]